MLKRNVTKDLKKEGKLFTPNVIDKVYESLGMSIVKADAKVEKNIKKEGEVFVPNVKENVYASVDVKPRNAFASFLLKPATLGVASAVLVAGVTLAIVLPLANKAIVTNEEVTETAETPSEEPLKVLSAPSTVNMKVVSASEAYSPAVMYAINTKGQVLLDNVLPLNNDASNIISNLDRDFNTRSTSTQYSVESFTGRYLTTALNLGYLERQDAAKVNKIEIEFIFDEDDELYFSGVVESINERLRDFIYENKVIATYTCEQNMEKSDEADSETLSYIRIAYELATKLFVTSDGKTVKVLCFSTVFEDWIEKYKNTSKEELLAYIDFLKYIDEMISDDTMKNSFMEDLAECSLFQEAIDDITERYQGLAQKYEANLALFNEKYNEHRPNFLPPLDGGWDWWDDFGHDHRPHEGGEHPHDGGEGPHQPPTRNRPDEPENDFYDLESYYNFVSLIESESYEIEEGMNKREAEEVLQLIEQTCDA